MDNFGDRLADLALDIGTDRTNKRASSCVVDTERDFEAIRFQASVATAWDCRSEGQAWQGQKEKVNGN